MLKFGDVTAALLRTSVRWSPAWAEARNCCSSSRAAPRLASFLARSSGSRLHTSHSHTKPHPAFSSYIIRGNNYRVRNIKKTVNGFS